MPSEAGSVTSTEQKVPSAWVVLPATAGTAGRASVMAGSEEVGGVAGLPVAGVREVTEAKRFISSVLFGDGLVRGMGW
jgi:hypothetical protein